ncbi:MAG: hypothetical protein ACXABY_08135 [Candidatus Thorarchaeota archaeon]|jgi:hypothetical protein
MPLPDGVVITKGEVINHVEGLHLLSSEDAIALLPKAKKHYQAYGLGKQLMRQVIRVLEEKAANEDSLHVSVDELSTQLDELGNPDEV